MNSESKTWVVIRTFNRREMNISSFLHQNGLAHFIPMTYREKFEGYDQKPRKVLVPVIHNYIFLEKTLPVDALLHLLAQCPVPLLLMRNKGDDHICEIPDRDMTEFRLLCDPEFSGTTFLEQDEAEALPGKEVEIVHGQFMGVRGKLYKKNQKYWFIKTVAGISVMLRISRWYCKVIA